jgi:hypothetical protein
MPTGKGTMKGSKFLSDRGGFAGSVKASGVSKPLNLSLKSIPGRGIDSSLTLGGS